MSTLKISDHRSRLAVLLAALGLFVAACGDDSSTVETDPGTSTDESEQMDDDSMEDDSMEDGSMEDDSMEDDSMEEGGTDEG